MNEKIEASDRSVAASEIIKSIITTGNNSPVFLGYERLRDAVIQPDEVFRRVHIESFVGRRWLIDQVDSILNDDNNSCGYLVLEAHAGLGKTAFLAWLVKERNYIHHFVELAPGQEGIEKGLRNLAAQIILAYKLSADEAIPDAAGRPDYLYRLLSQAADKRGPGERIVVVVDALDEAGTPPNQNVLGLRKALPEGVFFIVSMRPVQVTLQSDRSTTPRWPLKILAESRENLDDMKSFLQASAAWPKVKRALEKSRYTADDFIDALMKKSGGLWIYLHFVIPEIERGKRSPLDLDKLPEGLQEYYAGYWARWRKADKWYGLYLPILTTLAAAQESSTLDRMLDWAGIVAHDDEKLKLRRILKEEWRPFLAISGEGKEEKYRFYHATVREFFEGKAKQNSPMATENDLVDELSMATRERHRMIAERYLALWGGSEKGLPDLVNKIKEEDGYGLRHLAAHLEAAGQDDELHRLLSQETKQGKNLWYESKADGGDTSGYINDVMRAWRLVMEEYDPEDIENAGRFISLQNRYALVIASINSLLDSIPPELLLAMVESGIWSKEDGLFHVRRISDRIERMRLLIGLSLLLKEPKILDEALSTAREIKDEYLRAQTLAEIAPKLQDDQKRKFLEEALSTAREIKDEYLRAQILAEIASKLQDDQKRNVLDKALSTAREIKNEYLRAQALGVIAPKLEDAHEALELAFEIQDRYVHAYALAVIAPKLQDAHEAMKLVRKIKDEYLRAQALAEIAPKLQEAQKRVVLDETLKLVLEIQDREWRDEALAEIAFKLQDGHEALAWVRKIQDMHLRDYALAENAPKLQDPDEAFEAATGILYGGLFDQALAVIAPKFQDADAALILARVIDDRWFRAKAIAEIAPKLQEAQKREVLEEELTLVLEIQDREWRDQALAEIAPKLQDADKARALAREFPNKSLCVQALAEIASRLQGAQRKEVLDEATAITREIPDEWEHGLALDEIKRCERSLAQTVRKFRGTDKELATALEILDKESRAKALKEIVSSLLARNNLSFISLWKPTINSLSIRGRGDLLSDLSVLAPLMAEIGGDEALRETIQAIKDVGRWWP